MHIAAVDEAAKPCLVASAECALFAPPGWFAPVCACPPWQVKALGGSLLLTGAAAAGGFWVLSGLGLVDPDSPTSRASLTTAWDMMLRPHALQQQLKQQQQEQLRQQERQQQPKQQMSSK